MLFIAVPTIALVGLIALFVWADTQSLLALRRYHDTTEEIAALVERRVQIQDERHQLVDEGPQDVSPRGSDSTSELEQRLVAARDLAANRQPVRAAGAYTAVIDDLTQDIVSHLAHAPVGRADQQSDSLLALLDAQESFLREDLEARLRSADTLVMARLHTTASRSLDQFATHATPNTAAQLEALTVSQAWHTLTILRSEHLDNGLPLDTKRWGKAAKVRSTTLNTLVVAETSSLRTSIEIASATELQRLLLLVIIVGAVSALATYGAFALRRSIIGPLSTLRINARRMSKGELAPVADPANDEIAEVGRAFSSLGSTMEHIWTDVDAISLAMTKGVYDRRIDTSTLEGDWLRLAATMNATLETSEAHRDAVGEELDRRDVMTEISNAAVLTETAAELTAAVLRHLPRALVGSHAHLHEHPSGPPHTDLGITLEPSISALSIPTLVDQAQLVDLRSGKGVASLVAFPTGPPAILVLQFGEIHPAQPEPLVSLVETAGQILAQAHRRQLAESRATHNREHDLVTGLPNAAHLQRWFREQDDTSLAWTALGIAPQRLDELDGLFGRDARNLVLKEVASRLQNTVHDNVSDSESSLVARIGEPEFVVLVPSNSADRITEAIIESFSNPLVVGATEITIDVTVGVDQLDSNHRDLTQAVANLSASIRQASGRSTEVVVFEARHRDDVRHRTQLVRWLEHAIESRELSIHFQPVVNAVTTAIEGYECLIRGSRNGEPVSPAEFIPIAEETNLIMAIGEFALREACAALPFLRGENPYVAVNLSPVELGDPGLLDRIESVLTESAVDRERVIFEVTEGVTTSEADVDRLHELRALGVKIAIDDFGTGQSNLAYLNSLPAQVLKLDRSLVTPMVDDPGAAAIVRKSIEMAHDLGMTVVGEGVETNDELNALRRARCDLIQGWLTGRPAPLENFIEITIDRPVTQIVSPNEVS